MSWETFFRQYTSQGREKADGYARSHFENLTEDELSRARSMMAERGIGGDTTDLDGLRHIGNPQIIAELLGAQDRDAELGAGFELVRREVIFALTGDEKQLEPLLGYLDSRDMWVAQLAAEALARNPLSSGFSGEIADRLIAGRHERIKEPLLRAWLAARGIEIWKASEFDRMLPFIRALLARNPRQRARLLATWPHIENVKRASNPFGRHKAWLALAFFIVASVVAYRAVHSIPVGTGETRASPDGRFTASVMDWTERSFVTGTPRRWFHYRVTGPGLSCDFTSEPIIGPYFGSRSSHRVIHWDTDSTVVEFVFPTATLRISTMPADRIDPFVPGSCMRSL